MIIPTFTCKCGRTVAFIDTWTKRWDGFLRWEAVRCSKECLDRDYPPATPTRSEP